MLSAKSTFRPIVTFLIVTPNTHTYLLTYLLISFLSITIYDSSVE